MRLLSWNIAHPASPDKLREVADVVAHQHCDVVALQEVASSSIESLKASLGGLGLLHAAVHEHDKGWWLLTAARSPLVHLPAVSTAVPREERDYPRMPPVEVGETARILSVRLSSPALILHNVHVPPGSKVGWRKVDVFRALSEALASWGSELQVVCGDLNEPREERADGELVSWAFENDYARHDKKAWNDAVVGLLRGSLVADAFRQVHGNDAGEMWSHRRAKALRRYDHVLASPALQPVFAEYVDVTCSDHRPAVVQFA